jgi:hypothetical protein
MWLNHPFPSARIRILSVLKLILITGVYLTLWFPLCATTLNKDFNLSVWKDSSLWDDEARSAAQRIGLTSTQSRQGTETYRAGFPGTRTVLGQKIYAIDMYQKDGKVSQIIFGFINEADAFEHQGLSPADLPAQKRAAFNQLRIRLTKRLGRPSGEGEDLYWSWLEHTLHLRNTSKALLLEINPGKYNPIANAANSIIADKKRVATPPERYVKRDSNGDVYISGIPKVSQGDRGYCVPATWEKVLRHNGLNFNVYDLAGEGDTGVEGSYYALFTGRMKGLLQPHQYKIKHLRFPPEDLKQVATYINKGLPLIWHMDAQKLRYWVNRTRSRRGHLNDDSVDVNMSQSKAGHALLIIGYNLKENEIGLSDSTELGSSETIIWIHAEEAAAAHQRSKELLTVIPPGRSGSRDFLKARWY